MKITLQDGTVLDNLELNGNNFISSSIVDNSVFANNLGNVQIEDEDGNIAEHRFMKLLQNSVYNNESWFILAEKSENDRLKERVQMAEDTISFLLGL